MKDKEQYFKENPEQFLLECCVCKKNFLPLSYMQYKNLIAKHKRYNRNFFCSDECRRMHRGSTVVKCDNCGKEILINNWSYTHNKKHYCSRGCWKKSRSQNNSVNKEKEYKCLLCGKHFKGQRQKFNKFCSNECSAKYKSLQSIRSIETGMNVSHRVLRQYLIEKHHRCMNPECKWDWTDDNNPILELHHIDGDHKNNTLNNCILLCPNCHSLTENYKFKNGHKSTRKYREKYTKY